MKILNSLILFLTLISAINAKELTKEEVVTLKKDVNQFLVYESKNIDYLVKRAHPAAGKKGVIKLTFIKLIKQNRDMGVKIEVARVGEPSELFNSKSEEICLVPFELKIKHEESIVHCSSYFIAARTTPKGIWTFFEATDFKDNLDVIYKHFPGLPKDLDLPEIRIEEAEASIFKGTFKEVSKGHYKIIHEEADGQIKDIKITKNKVYLKGEGINIQFDRLKNIPKSAYMGKFYSSYKDDDYESSEIITRGRHNYDYDCVSIFHDNKEYTKQLDEDVPFLILSEVLTIEEYGYFWVMKSFDENKTIYVDSSGDEIIEYRFKNHKHLEIPKGYKKTDY